MCGWITNFSLETRAENPHWQSRSQMHRRTTAQRRGRPRPDAGGFKPTSISYSSLASAGPSVHREKNRQMRTYYGFPENRIRQVFKLACNRCPPAPITAWPEASAAQSTRRVAAGTPTTGARSISARGRTWEGKSPSVKALTRPRGSASEHTPAPYTRHDSPSSRRFLSEN